MDKERKQRLEAAGFKVGTVDEFLGTDRDLVQELDRLRDFVRLHSKGGCRLLSVGDGCRCLLCLIDRAADALAQQDKELAEIKGHNASLKRCAALQEKLKADALAAHETLVSALEAAHGHIDEDVGEKVAEPKCSCDSGLQIAVCPIHGEPLFRAPQPTVTPLAEEWNALKDDRDSWRRTAERLEVEKMGLAAPTVTPEMVERAAKKMYSLALYSRWERTTEATRKYFRTTACEVLTAALGEPTCPTCGGTKELGLVPYVGILPCPDCQTSTGEGE